MLVLKLKPHLTKDEIKQKLNSQKEVRSYKQWQMLYSVALNEGKKSEEIASILGISKEILQRTVKQFNKHGIDFQQMVQWGGRRDSNSFLTLEQEKQMMGDFANKAAAGRILTFKDIKQEVEKKLEREVSQDYIWDLFHRSGWGKKAPRPKHPKQDKDKQQEFKKNSPKYWQPTS